MSIEETLSSEPAPATAASGGRLPDFLIVGQPKCGTTALGEMLRSHPQVFMPANKELWFFASELYERMPPRPEGTPRTLAEYKDQFRPAGPEQRAGEASVLYLWSRTAAQAIHAAAPAAKIIAIVREPASLLRSLHLQFLQTHVETETDLRTALSLEPLRRRGERIPRHTYWPAALRYSEHVRYVEQLSRYYELFPREQILVGVYDDFRGDNDAFVGGVLRFLGVDDSVALARSSVNPTVHPRSQALHELVHAVGVGRGSTSRAVKGVLKAVMPAELRRRALYETQRRLVFSEPPPADQRLMSELRSRYKDEVLALSAFLDRDLVSLWGYDRVG